MAVEIPVTTSITIVKGDSRWTCKQLTHSANNEDILLFAQAINYMQYGSPADKFVKRQRREIKAEA